jgi:hypothetical protein
MGAILDRIPEEQIDAAKRVDLLALAESYTQLRRKTAAGEYEGPCPRCGGSKRFVVHERERWWFCRDCHPKRGDSIEFVRWQQPGLSFPDAVSQLAGNLVTKAVTRRQPERQAPATKPQPANWRKRAEAIAAEAHERLWENEQAQAYLLGRGIEPHTWLQYGLGYCPDAPLPGTKGRQRAPALVIPWRSRVGVYALRYRFLKVQHYTDSEGKERSEKLVAETGSQFAGKLFGGQALPEWVYEPAPEGYEHRVQKLCTLLIVEGEINAMSCWQVASETHLHVLSLGSEGQTIPAAALPLIQRYGKVLVWADKERIAQRLMSALPGAVGIHSPGGKDANDLLQAGLLGGFLATMRANHAKSHDELEGLLWALYDAARLPAGIDTGSAKILQRLAAQLGKQAAIYEPEPGRWITVAHCE